VEQHIRTQAQAKKDFEKALSSLSYTNNNWTVFEDFLDYTLLMLKWQDRKEEYFDDLRKRYPKEEQHKLFAEAFYALADIADNNGTGFYDPFGDYFMEHFGNKFKGQFFTPDSVTEFMAAIIIADDTPEKKTVCDPTCGSGRTLLSAAKHNRNLIFYGADIDINCCKMTVINMMLNTMVGEVAWMDTLSMKHWKSWHINKVYNGAGYLPYYQVTGPGETHFIERLQSSLQRQSEDESSNIKVGKRQQIMLF
jgi:type I restriction-modification system DNA methylase subunit